MPHVIVKLAPGSSEEQQEPACETPDIQGKLSLLYKKPGYNPFEQ